MTSQSNHKTDRVTPDFSLLVSRLETEILKGTDPEKCTGILNRRDLWSRLDPEARLKWAELAQMSGQAELALKVLSDINGRSPEFKRAWHAHLELLAILDRRSELAQLTAKAQKIAGIQLKEALLNLAPSGETGVGDNMPEMAAAPFAALRERERLIGRFLKLFAGREDCFARQWVDKNDSKQGYVPVKRPLEPLDLEDHLKGTRTYGIYLLRSDATVTTAVMDVDLKKAFQGKKLDREERDILRREGSYVMKRIRDMAEEAGFRPLVEFSGGKGFHFWFIMDRPVTAGQARDWLTPMREALYRDLSAFSIEVFPKQTSLSGKGLGNLVKLPLGVHRLTGKRSYFFECPRRDTDSQLRFLTTFEPCNVEKVVERAVSARKENVILHPRLKKWSGNFPQLQRLETACPPLGQIMATCRERRACTDREEKILLQTLGFLPGGKTLMHHLLAPLPDYNPHLVDFKLSRLRGTPLGCKRIHSLTGFSGDMCVFEEGDETYAHPLRHLKEWKGESLPKSEKAENLQDALENLNSAILQVKRFME